MKRCAGWLARVVTTALAVIWFLLVLGLIAAIIRDAMPLSDAGSTSAAPTAVEARLDRIESKLDVLLADGGP